MGVHPHFRKPPIEHIHPSISLHLLCEKRHRGHQDRDKDRDKDREKRDKVRGGSPGAPAHKVMVDVPSGTNIAVENHHAIHGKIHYQIYQWSFSIAMLNYQRVVIIIL